MKRGTPDHPKTEMLSMLLGINVAQAVGHLELLWHFAAKYAPAGDIGRWPDEMIAKRCGWGGDPEAFINALIEARGQGKFGWIEEHARHRLVIHDWPEHADEAVKKWLANHNEAFWSGDMPFAKRVRSDQEPVANESRMSRDKVEMKSRLPEPEPEPEPEPVLIPLTPFGGMDHQAPVKQTAKAEKPELPLIPAELDTPEFRVVWAEWIAYRSDIRKRITPRAASMQLKMLAGLGSVQAAIDSVMQSITNQYQGIFPPHGKAAAPSRMIGAIPTAVGGHNTPSKPRETPLTEETDDLPF